MIAVGEVQENGSGWTCQHAMDAVSNLIVESIACSSHLVDEGEQIVAKVISNATAH
jgi:hypothetical protein